MAFSDDLTRRWGRVFPCLRSTVDLGVPSLSMHSIRETVGVSDISNNYEILKAFFAQFETLFSKFTGF